MAASSLWRGMDTEQAARLFTFYKTSLLLPLHALITSAALIGFLKGEVFVLPLFVYHGVGIWACTSHSTSQKPLRVAALANGVGTLYAIIANVMWACGLITPSAIAVKAWSAGLSYISHTLNTTLESMYALTLLPAPVVAAGLLIREVAIYRGLQPYGYAPSPILWGLFYVIETSLPHLLILYMHKIQQRPRVMAGNKPSKAAAGKGIAEDAGAPEKQGRLEAKQREAEQDLAAIRGGSQKSGRGSQVQAHHHHQLEASGSGSLDQGQGALPTARQLAHPQPQPLHDAGLPHQPSAPSSLRPHLSKGPRPRPCQASLQALVNARNMVRRSAALRPYTSRLPCSQVITIKLHNAEPEMLVPELITETNKALQAAGNLGLRATSACVRNGCVVVSLDLWQVGAHLESAHRDPAFSSTPGEVPELLSPSVAIAPGGKGLEDDPPGTGSQTPSASSTYCSNSSTCAADWLHSSGSNAVNQPGHAQEDRCDSAAGHKASGDFMTKDGLEMRVDLDVPTLQRCLQSLLPAGTPLPEGSLAHIVMGGRHLTAAWQQGEGGGHWVVTPQPQLPASPMAGQPGMLALLHVDQAVALVPAGKSGANAVHSMRFLLQLEPGKEVPTFSGSDAVSAVGAAPQLGGPATTSAPDVIYCTARGSWGTYLPVAVSEVVSGPADEREGGGLLVALTLDVDLATAPGPGAVQLELWHGLNILASAPLLILPPQPQEHSALLVEELGQHVEQCSWEVDDTHPGSSTPSGVAAFLSDLGQLLHVVHCISSADQPGGGDAVDGSWGGVVHGITHHRSSDPGTLAACLSLAEGLQEHAAATLLPAVAATVQEAASKVQERLQRVLSHQQQQESGAAAGHVHTPAQPSKQELMMPPTTLRDIARAMVSGFAPPIMEQQYATWLGRQCTTTLMLWRPLFLLLQLVTLAKTARTGGMGVLLQDLPVQLLLAAPQVIGIVVMLRKQYRVMEGVTLLYVATRALVCLGCWAGALTYPSSWRVAVKAGLDVYVEVLINCVTEPVRLPSLLVMQPLLLGAGMARAALFGAAGSEWLARALIPRFCAVLVGAAMDMRRRALFVKQQLQKPAAALPSKFKLT